MTELHPSIINQIRREALRKDPERSILPAQRRPEAEELVDDEPPATTVLGRLATRLNMIGGTGEI